MDQKEHAIHDPADDTEFEQPTASSDEEDGDDPPPTKSGREIERG